MSIVSTVALLFALVSALAIWQCRTAMLRLADSHVKSAKLLTLNERYGEALQLLSSAASDDPRLRFAEWFASQHSAIFPDLAPRSLRLN